MAQSRICYWCRCRFEEKARYCVNCGEERQEISAEEEKLQAEQIASGDVSAGRRLYCKFCGRRLSPDGSCTCAESKEEEKRSAKQKEKEKTKGGRLRGSLDKKMKQEPETQMQSAPSEKAAQPVQSETQTQSAPSEKAAQPVQSGTQTQSAPSEKAAQPETWSELPQNQITKKDLLLKNGESNRQSMPDELYQALKQIQSVSSIQTIRPISQSQKDQEPQTAGEESKEKWNITGNTGEGAGVLQGEDTGGGADGFQSRDAVERINIHSGGTDGTENRKPENRTQDNHETEKPDDPSRRKKDPKPSSRIGIILGAVLVLAAGGFAVSQILPRITEERQNPEAGEGEEGAGGSGMQQAQVVTEEGNVVILDQDQGGDLQVSEQESVTAAPTPDTEAPVTERVTEAPTTEHVTEAPVTERVTEALVTERVTEAPVTERVTEAPVTEPDTVMSGEAAAARLKILQESYRLNQVSYDDVLNELRTITGEVPNIPGIADITADIDRMQVSHTAYDTGVSYAGNGMYLEAAREMEKVQTDDGYYADAVQKRNDYIASYETAVCTKADGYLENNDPDTAQSVIAEALAQLPEDQVLTARLEEIKGMYPKQLNQLKVLGFNNVYAMTGGNVIADVKGNTYSTDNLYVLDAQDGNLGYMTVECSGNYASMGGMTGVVSTSSPDPGARGCIEIYADGQLIYVSPRVLDSTSEPLQFGVDISGADEITISIGQQNASPEKLEILLAGVCVSAGNDLVMEGYSNEYPQEFYQVIGDSTFYDDGTVVPQNGYILPDSATRYLDESDIEHLTLKGLCFAKNEIYARYGREFKAAELKQYFEGQSWYEGTYEPTDENDAMIVGWMNQYENYNKDFLWAAEQKIGPYDVK